MEREPRLKRIGVASSTIVTSLSRSGCNTGTIGIKIPARFRLFKTWDEEKENMLISRENRAIREKILDLDRRIEEMHLNFQKYSQGIEPRRPDLEMLERELLSFSRRKVVDLELSKQLDRVLLKFQNRKRIWLRWAEEYHRGGSRQ